MKPLFLIILLSLGLYAKPSRVIDVQESIKTDVEEYIKKFAPDAKYSVSVKVVPLTRNPRLTGEDELPFLDYESENIVDEWDDPIRSTYSLYSRIKEVEITLVFNADINVKDTSRFKDTLLKSVNLIPGRDRVAIESMSGPLIQKEFNITDHIDYLILASILLATMIIGIGLNALSRKIGPPVKTTSQEKSSGGSAQPASMPAMPMASSMGASSQTSSNQGMFSGGLNLEDPKRIHDMVKGRIDKLVKSGNFPTFNDLIILENELESNPKSFSYLIYEFPIEYQKKIYELGRGTEWFNGFLDVGFPTRSIIVALDKMVRSRNDVTENKLNELLVYMWRLDDQLADFIKETDKDLALKLLKLFPKNISIPVSRECFPGTWGEVLNDNFQKIDIKGDKLVKMMNRCLELKPLYKYEALQKYKSKTDLISYLDHIEPHEEKEIYTIISSDDDLGNVRAPFFKFFELEEEKRREVFEAFQLNDWAYACFNIERKDREAIKDIMDEKEKYLFGHAMKQLDNAQWDRSVRVDIRNRIASFVYENYETFETESVNTAKKKDAFDDFLDAVDDKKEDDIEDKAA